MTKIEELNTSPIQAPLIHLNGSSRDRLIEAYTVALDSVRVAGHKLSGINLNNRDYYPLGDQAWKRATTQQMSCEAKLTAVERMLEEILIQIVDQ